MNLFQILNLLRVEAGRLAPLSPGTKWYLFGSVLRSVESANDTDVLVIYEKEQHAEELRGGMAGVRVLPPLHLLLMRADEEEELKFRMAQKCVEIYPDDDLSPSL
jgi:hypothetical protein